MSDAQPLDEAAVEAMVSEALAAIAVADTVADLRSVRLAHTGEKAPLALANREIGRLSPADRKVVGQLLGQARARVN
ncbi:MAG: phenylalanine--tRNA ligase subunit alpha, partial [Propionibacteriaceae bacterium]